MPEADSITTLLAFDYGRRRTGVAIGQTITGSARGLLTLEALGEQPDWQQIAALIDQWQPDLLLVGLPRRADGSDSEQTLAARAFASELGQFDLPVQLIDEHLTSNDASRQLAEQRRSGRRSRRVRKQDIDALSAALIAEQWLHERLIR
ncbi:MAG: Holliday junction resolvase RuvX [Pseudomonadota bacterium]